MKNARDLAEKHMYIGCKQQIKCYRRYSMSVYFWHMEAITFEPWNGLANWFDWICLETNHIT
jgi:hypothetical protein